MRQRQLPGDAVPITLPDGPATPRVITSAGPAATGPDPGLAKALTLLKA